MICTETKTVCPMKKNISKSTLVCPMKTNYQTLVECVKLSIFDVYINVRSEFLNLINSNVKQIKSKNKCVNDMCNFLNNLGKIIIVAD